MWINTVGDVYHTMETYTMPSNMLPTMVLANEGISRILPRACIGAPMPHLRSEHLDTQPLVKRRRPTTASRYITSQQPTKIIEAPIV